MYRNSNLRGRGPRLSPGGFALMAVLTALLQACSPSGTSQVDPETGQPTATTFSKSYGGPGFDIAHAVRATRDGGIVFVGHSGGVPGDGREDGGPNVLGGDLWISKLDANGNVEAQRLLGLIPAGEAGRVTEFSRVRDTADDGYIAVGSTGGDLAVARFTTDGVVVWAQTYDSGAWLNYDFPAGQAAVDLGRDVWPLPDGGFWVVADSYANLRDVRNIGFDAPNNQSDLFVGARSVFVVRIDSQGMVRFRQRLTEHAFGSYGRDRFDFPIIRATSDGGAVIARSKRFSRTVDAVGGTRQEEQNFALVQRLFGDASLSWTQRVADGSLIPADLIQTDDAVDRVAGSEFPVRDGVSDDGFLFAANVPSGCARLIKLAPDGEVEWSNAYDCDTFSVPDPDSSMISSVHEFCEGSPPICTYLLGGSRREEGEASRGTVRRVFAGDGTNIAFQLLADPDVRAVERVARAVPVGGSLVGIGTYRLLTRDNGGGVGQILTLNGTTLETLTRRTIDAEVGHETLLEPTPDGGALVFNPAGNKLVRVARNGSFPETFLLNARGERTDRGLAVLETTPGRFIVAGDSRSFSETEGADDVRREAWVAAYDLIPGRESIVWQRRLMPGLNGQISALAATADGGIVVAGKIGAAIRAVKLDSQGEVVWRSLPIQGRLGPTTVLRELDATADGGFIALIAEDNLQPGAAVAKLGADGAVLWQRRYWLEDPGSIEPVDADRDGARDDGFVLAGGGQSSFDLATVVRTDGTGQVLWAKSIQPASLNRWEGESLDRPRIRQLPDGGFVVATTEIGELTTLDSSGELQPRGQTNILLLKLSANGEAEWGRIYGALYDEGMRDLDVAPDGSILVAGTSDSFGEQREAWLLKLGPDGLIGAGGCNGFLGTHPASFLSTRDVDVGPLEVAAVADADPSLDVRTTAAPARTTEELVTARQCLGSANPTSPTSPTSPSSPSSPAPQFTLTVTQAGQSIGVVTSTPRGIACGTGAGDEFCSARFQAGTRVSLRAEGGNFVRWVGACEDGTGLGNRLCVLTVDRDLSMAVDFGPPPPRTLFGFRIAVQGDGRVSGGGLSCREDSPPSSCATSFFDGTAVNLVAAPDQDRRFVGWTGDCVQHGTQMDITVTVNRHLECFAQFTVTEQPSAMIAVTVTGLGTVRDDTATAINCREGSPTGDCSEFFHTSDIVTLTATPDSGHRFVRWGGDCAQFGELPTARLVPVQDQTCTAQFAPPVTNALLTVQLAGESTVGLVESHPAGILCSRSPTADCTEFYPPGTDVLLHATPGTAFAGWEGCDVIIDVTGCRVTLNVARTVIARFSP